MDSTERKYNKIPLECALTILECRGILNQYLHEEGLPSIRYRVSSEYGRVMLASTNTIIDVDVFGSTVNYCAKINKLADPNEFIIGHDLKTIIGKTDEFDIKEKLSFKTDLKFNFPVYSVCRK